MAPSRDPVTFEYNFEKVLAALVYLASQPGRVTNLDKKKAISLLFLADRAHLLRYGEPIFGDYYRALPYGTVPQETLRRLDKLYVGPVRGRDILQLAESLEIVLEPFHDYPILKARVAPNLDVLSELELKALDDVVNQYGLKDFQSLEGPIHPRAWHKAWNSKPENAKAAPMSYEDFFEGEPEAAKGALDHMIEEFKFRQALASGPR